MIRRRLTETLTAVDKQHTAGHRFIFCQEYCAFAEILQGDRTTERDAPQRFFHPRLRHFRRRQYRSRRQSVDPDLRRQLQRRRFRGVRQRFFGERVTE